MFAGAPRALTRTVGASGAAALAARRLRLRLVLPGAHLCSSSPECPLARAAKLLRQPERAADHADRAQALRLAWQDLRVRGAFDECRTLALPADFVRLLSQHEDSAVRKEACLAVVICASDESTAEELVGAGVLPPLLEIVSDSDAVDAGLRAGGTLAVGNLASHPRLSSRLWAAETADGNSTLAVLQKHLTARIGIGEPTDPVIRAVLEAISSCTGAVSAERRLLALEIGLVDQLAEILIDVGAASNLAPETEVALLFAIQNTLASQPQNQSAFCAAGGLRQVVEKLKQVAESSSLQMEYGVIEAASATVVQSISLLPDPDPNQDTQDAAMHAGAVPCLVVLLNALEQEAEGVDTQALSKARAVQQVLLALGKCVQQNSSAQQECIAAGGVELISHQLKEMEERYLLLASDDSSELVAALGSARAWGALVLGECAAQSAQLLDDEDEQIVVLGLLNRMAGQGEAFGDETMEQQATAALHKLLPFYA